MFGFVIRPVRRLCASLRKRLHALKFAHAPDVVCLILFAIFGAAIVLSSSGKNGKRYKYKGCRTTSIYGEDTFPPRRRIRGGLHSKRQSKHQQKLNHSPGFRPSQESCQQSSHHHRKESLPLQERTYSAAGFVGAREQCQHGSYPSRR